MNRDQARNIVKETFTQKFGAIRFLEFIGNLLNAMEQFKGFVCNSQYIKNILAMPVKGVGGEAS